MSVNMYYRNANLVSEEPGYHPHLETRFTCNDVKELAGKGNQLPSLYDNRVNCCGCGACKCICPVSAITRVEDEEGFLYPVVNADTCIGCQKCASVCILKHTS